MHFSFIRAWQFFQQQVNYLSYLSFTGSLTLFEKGLLRVIVKYALAYLVSSQLGLLYPHVYLVSGISPSHPTSDAEVTAYVAFILGGAVIVNSFVFSCYSVSSISTSGAKEAGVTLLGFSATEWSVRGLRVKFSLIWKCKDSCLMRSFS